MLNQAKNPSAPAKPTILVVDDLELNRTLLRSFLEQNYHIVEAKNGAEALARIKQGGAGIDLIISDNHMDTMTGLELLGRLSQNPWLKRIPVIMMSSDRSQEFVNEAYALGAADFFFTPFVPQLIQHRVKYTLDSSRRHRETLLNSVHAIGEFCFILMLLDLDKDTCEILDTSERADMWDKDILITASKTIRLFTEHGYIHPDDLADFLTFTDPARLRAEFLSGAAKTHFRYRRAYQGSYRWALMEVVRTADYSPDCQTVVMFSRDIQDNMEEQSRSFDRVSAHAVFSDYCNITRNCLYHNESDNYIAHSLRDFDTVTQAVNWGAALLKRAEDTERYLKLFSAEHLAECYRSGQQTVSFEHSYRIPGDGVRVFRTSIQLFQNIYTKDLEGIYYVEDVSLEYVHKRITENIFYHDYVFVGIWDTNEGDMYVHKTGDSLYDSGDKMCVPYQEVIHFRSNRLSMPQEEYERITGAAYVLERLSAAGEYSFKVETVSEDGRPFTLEYVYRYLERKDGAVTLMIRNITEAAERDSITDGMNRSGFNREAEWYLSTHDRQDYSMLYFDVQDFKAVNELLGFEVGNEILREVCRLLTDSPLQPVFTARLMADQFVCLVPRCRVDEAVLLSLCRTNVEKRGLPIVLRMHCGIYDIEAEDSDVRSMCDKAKMALAVIENEYTTPYSRFKYGMNLRYLEQINVVNNISDALENNEFVVFYQPIYDAAEERLVSAEALIRWRDSSGSFVRPDIFIPVLEEKGIISRLDHFVAEEVNRFILSQKKQGKPYIPVSINLSRMDFYDQRMLRSILEMIEQTQIEPEQFKFEITESSFADVSKLDRRFLNAVRSMGCQILIDDFGTGYSSLLSVSKQFFDLLKIDMSFVREIGKDYQTEAVIQTVIDMAHRMNARTVAEGVETRQQIDFLRENGCDYLQGYYFSKPVPAEEFRAMLNELAE